MYKKIVIDAMKQVENIIISISDWIVILLIDDGRKMLMEQKIMTKRNIETESNDISQPQQHDHNGNIDVEHYYRMTTNFK